MSDEFVCKQKGFVLVDKYGNYITGNELAEQILGIDKWRGANIRDIQLPNQKDTALHSWAVFQCLGRANGTTAVMGAVGEPVYIDYRAYVLGSVRNVRGLSGVVFWPSQVGLEWLSYFLRAMPKPCAYRQALQHSLTIARQVAPDLLE